MLPIYFLETSGLSMFSSSYSIQSPFSSSLEGYTVELLRTDTPIVELDFGICELIPENTPYFYPLCVLLFKVRIDNYFG